MSKKRNVTKAVTKAVKGLAAKKRAPARKSALRAPVSRTAAAPSNRTAAATIFLYKSNGEQRIRTSPQLLPAGPGYIEWTVVNLASDDPVDVEITWPHGGPWGKAPIQIRNGNARVSCAGARDGRYKYNVTANGYTEDPEIEIPEI